MSLWREDDAGGKYETVYDDACKTGRRVPRTPSSCQTHERSAREAPGHDGTKEKPDERSSGGSSEKKFQEIRDLDEKELLKKGRVPRWRKGEIQLLLEVEPHGKQ